MDAALEIIATDGVARLTMREAARRSKVSSGAPYRHFSDVAALLSALVAEAVELLEIATERAMQQAPSDPLSQFRASGVAFVVFAAEHPLHFRLMCTPDLIGGAMAEHHTEADQRTTRAIAESLDAGLIAGDPDAIALTTRAAVYGLAHMIADGQLGPITADRARALAMTVTETVAAGFLK